MFSQSFLRWAPKSLLTSSSCHFLSLVRSVFQDNRAEVELSPVLRSDKKCRHADIRSLFQPSFPGRLSTRILTHFLQSAPRRGSERRHDVSPRRHSEPCQGLARTARCALRDRAETRAANYFGHFTSSEQDAAAGRPGITAMFLRRLPLSNAAFISFG